MDVQEPAYISLTPSRASRLIVRRPFPLVSFLLPVRTVKGPSGFSAMKDYAQSFYKSKTWQDCRAAYFKQARGLCERCLKKGVYKAGEIVHHKKHITPANICDPAITLSFDNLELVCRDCHAELHKERSAKRYSVDKWGRVYTTATKCGN